MKIQIKKNTQPILNPDDYHGKYISIRNPGAAKLNEITYLLVTIRYSKDRKMRMHLAKSKNGKDFVLDETPFIDNDDESVAGVEDARVTKINNEYFITFTAFNGHDKEDDIITRIGIAKTKDFKTYSNRKVILRKSGNNKNGVLFKSGEFFYIIHRPFGRKIKYPSAHIARTKDLKNFEHLGKLLSTRKDKWDNARVGINTPPIKIKHKKFGECLFSIYHGATIKDNIYQMGYILLDKDNPTKILERSDSPLISPTLDWEKIGEVNNVVFGCGLIPLSKNKARFYYGGADKYIGFADLIFQDAEIIE